MKMFVISDNNDTLMGLRLTGVDGVVVHTEAEAKAQIARVLGDQSIAILLLGGMVSALCPAEIDSIRQNRALPLVVEIPDRHGTGRSEDAISEYIRSAIGINTNHPLT